MPDGATTFWGVARCPFLQLCLVLALVLLVRWWLRPSPFQLWLKESTRKGLAAERRKRALWEAAAESMVTPRPQEDHVQPAREAAPPGDVGGAICHGMGRGCMQRGREGRGGR